MTIEHIKELRAAYKRLCDVSDVPEWKRKITLKFHNLFGDHLDERESKTAQMMIKSFESLPELLRLAGAGIDLMIKLEEMDIEDHKMPRTNEVANEFFKGWNTSSMHWRSKRYLILEEYYKSANE